jgi:vacuolar-type H+-ATPase subunit F/Vma7
MSEIGVLTDKNTATCFKLAGLRAVFPVDDPVQAEKTFLEIIKDHNIRILLVSEQILNRIRFKSQTSEQQFPLIIPIPTMKRGEGPEFDFMTDLIKRKTGIEVKL